MRGPQSLRALEEAWRRDASSVFVRLADAYREAGRLEDATRVIERGLREAPGHLAGRVVQARLHLDRDAPELAEGALRAVLEDQPEHWGARRLLARMYRAAGRWADEVEQLAELDRLHPGDSEVRAALRRAVADRDFRPALPAAAPDAGARTASTDAPWGDRPRPAAPVAPRPVGREPGGDPFQNATMAELLLAQGDVAGARRVYRRLLEADPGRESWRARLVELGGEPPERDAGAVPEALDPDLAADLLAALSAEEPA